MPESQEQRQEQRVFTNDIKPDAVHLTKERGNISQVARDLDAHECMLSRWKRHIEKGVENPFPGQGNAQDPELAQLKQV